MRSANQWRQYLQSMKSKECTGHRSKVHSLEWNCTGSKLASGSTDHSIRIWLLDTLLASSKGGVTSSELRGHAATVEQLAWHPSGTETLASVSADGTVRIWDTASMSCVACVELGSENINLAWSRDGSRLVVGAKDDTVTLIDVTTGATLAQKKFHQEVNELAWSRDGEIFAARAAGTIDILDGRTLDVLDTLQGHTTNCYCLQFEPCHGKYFAVGGADAVVSLWSTAERACIRTFCRLEWPIRAVSFNCDGDVLAAASEDAFIDISYVPTGESLLKLPTTAATNTLAWHPKRSILAYAGDHVDSRSRSSGIIYIFAAP